MNERGEVAIKDFVERDEDGRPIDAIHRAVDTLDDLLAIKNTPEFATRLDIGPVAAMNDVELLRAITDADMARQAADELSKGLLLVAQQRFAASVAELAVATGAALTRKKAQAAHIS